MNRTHASHLTVATRLYRAASSGLDWVDATGGADMTKREIPVVGQFATHAPTRRPQEASL